MVQFREYIIRAYIVSERWSRSDGHFRQLEDGVSVYLEISLSHLPSLRTAVGVGFDTAGGFVSP